MAVLFESEQQEIAWRNRNEFYHPFNCFLNECRGFTPLHTALYWGEDFQVALLLKKKKTDVNALDAKGRTPLHIFCIGQCAYNKDEKTLRKRLDVIQLLADYGANFTAKDNDGKTPLEVLWGPPVIHVDKWMVLKEDLMKRFDSQFYHTFKRTCVTVEEEDEIEEDDELKHGLNRARVLSEAEFTIEETNGEQV